MLFEVAGMLALGAILIFVKLPDGVKRVAMEFPLVTDLLVTWAIYSMHDSGVLGTLASAISGAIFAGFLGVYSAIYKDG